MNDTTKQESPVQEQRYDVDGKPFVYGTRMSKRQYYSHGGPGWDFRFHQPEFNLSTGEVENDEPWPPEKR